MATRKAIGKRQRFEIFKRDGFTCQYCGRTPPTVILECDHITPVAEGGTNDSDNLTAACFDCNRGKGATSLHKVPQSLADKAYAIQEAEEQLAGYSAILMAKKARVEADVWPVIEALTGERETSHSNFRSAKMFVERLGAFGTLEAAEIARAKFNYPNSQQWKYFCGVCWGMIRANEDG